MAERIGHIASAFGASEVEERASGDGQQQACSPGDPRGPRQRAQQPLAGYFPLPEPQWAVPLLGALALMLSLIHICLRDFLLRTAALAAAGILAVGSNFSPLWYTAKHSKETIRGGSELAATAETSKNGLALDYATAWSLSLIHISSW